MNTATWRLYSELPLTGITTMTTLKPINYALFLLALWISHVPAQAQYAGAKPLPDDLKPGFDAVKVDDAKRVLSYLATKCAGRGTGQAGYEKAARFVASEFKRIGLKPLGDNVTYFQRATVSKSRQIWTEFRGPGGSAHLNRSDFHYFHGYALDQLAGSSTVSGPPLFVEYRGNTADQSGYSQFQGRIVFLHFPDSLRRDQRILQQYYPFEESVLNAGPSAVFDVRDQFDQEDSMGWEKRGLRPGPLWRLAESPLEYFGHRQVPDPHYGLMSVRGELAIMHAAKVDKLNIPVAGSVAVTPGIEPLTFTVRGELDQVTTENVVGLMEGSDPILKSEFVVVGGHLDHFGIRHGKVYPGADDDGSGAADVIEVARAMAANAKRPRRSIVFVTFFGEEQGLLGSTFFVQHALVPIEKIVAELQMDMVGRDSDGDQQDRSKKRVDTAAENIDTIRIVGSKKISTEMDKYVQNMNEFVNFRLLYDSESVYGRSDDANFIRYGIPTTWLFSGFHPDYHKPTDTVDKIDWVKLTSAAKLCYLTAHAIADADAPPRRDVPAH